MKEVYNDATLECSAAEVISRKIMRSIYAEIDNIGKCLTYKCSLNSEATIKKELDPKNPLINEFSLLNNNDKLESDKLYVAIKAIRPYRIKKSNHTHRHKAQVFTTNKFTFAKITQQLSNIPLLDPPKVIKIIEPGDEKIDKP